MNTYVKLISYFILFTSLGVAIGSHLNEDLSEGLVITYLTFYSSFVTVLSLTSFRMLRTARQDEDKDMKGMAKGYIDGIKDSSDAVARLFGEDKVQDFINEAKKVVAEQGKSNNKMDNHVHIHMN